MEVKHQSREELLRENLRLRLEIEQLFTEADSWNKNVRKMGEPKLNPDPDGVLARNWLKLHANAIKMGGFFKPAMEAHFKKYAKLCDHEKIDKNGMCVNCSDFVYGVYCPNKQCGWIGVDAVDAPCPKCLTPLQPDDVV